jgi:hypothetical protein
VNGTNLSCSSKYEKVECELENKAGLTVGFDLDSSTPDVATQLLTSFISFLRIASWVSKGIAAG